MLTQSKNTASNTPMETDMARKRELTGGHIEVYLRNPNDFGFFRSSGHERSEAQVQRDLEVLQRAIKTRLNASDDNYGGCRVIPEYTDTCEHCGWPWTEESAAYNGGCCDEDEAGRPSNEEAAA